MSLYLLSLSLSLSCSPIEDLHKTPLLHFNSSSHSLVSPSLNKQLNVIIFFYLILVSGYGIHGVTRSTLYSRSFQNILEFSRAFYNLLAAFKILYASSKAHGVF